MSIVVIVPTDFIHNIRGYFPGIRVIMPLSSVTTKNLNHTEKIITKSMDIVIWAYFMVHNILNALLNLTHVVSKGGKRFALYFSYGKCIPIST